MKSQNKLLLTRKFVMLKVSSLVLYKTINTPKMVTLLTKHKYMRVISVKVSSKVMESSPMLSTSTSVTLSKTYTQVKGN